MTERQTVQRAMRLRDLLDARARTEALRPDQFIIVNAKMGTAVNLDCQWPRSVPPFMATTFADEDAARAALAREAETNRLVSNRIAWAVETAERIRAEEMQALDGFIAEVTRLLVSDVLGTESA